MVAAFLRDNGRIFFFLSQLVVFIFLWQLGGGKYTVGPTSVAGVAFFGVSFPELLAVS